MIRAASGISGCARRLRRKRATPPSATSPRTNAAAAGHHRRRRSPGVECCVPRVVETSRGRFVVHVQRAWAPRGADRFYELINQHFFDEARFESYRALGYHSVMSVANVFANFAPTGVARV